MSVGERKQRPLRDRLAGAGMAYFSANGAGLAQLNFQVQRGSGMDDVAMVELPAAHLLRVVGRVLENTSPFAEEAPLVADEILRLRDTGQLSKVLGGDLGMLIYQRRMHAEHSGEFKLTASISHLEGEIDQHQRERLPDAQVDTVHVHPRILDLAADIPTSTRRSGNEQEAAGLLVSIARLVAGSITPGWESLRYVNAGVGNFMSDLTFVQRSGVEERVHVPLIELLDKIDDLKRVSYLPGLGTWIGFTMVLTPSGGLTVDYNFDKKPEFGFEVSAHDYQLELEFFPVPKNPYPRGGESALLTATSECPSTSGEGPAYGHSVRAG